MLEVQLELAGPEIRQLPSTEGVRALATGWVKSFFAAGLLMKRLDTGEGE